MIKKTIAFILILFITLSLYSYESNGRKYSFYQNNNTNFEDVPVDEDEGDAAFKILLLIALAPFYIPYGLLERDETGPLKFQKYPFENTNSFYFDEGKNWCVNSSLLLHYINAKDDSYGFGSNIYFQYNRFGLRVNIFQYKSKNNEKLSKLSIYPFYTFARNEFINFQTGIGYNYEKSNEGIHGLVWNYQINLYSKPLRFQLSNDLIIGFPKNKENVRYNENLNVNISYYIKSISLSLGYYFNTVNKETMYGPFIGMNYYF